MPLNGDMVDEVAREQAKGAHDMALSAYEGVGKLLREMHAFRDEILASFDDLKHRMLGSEPPSPWGRRAYDPDEEITETGHRVKVPVERFRRMEKSLANVEKRELDAAQKTRDAALKEQGANELIRKWSKRAALAAPVVMAIGGGIWELVKFLLKLWLAR